MRSIAATLRVLALLLVATTFAEAQEKPPCERFAWPLDREKALFAGTRDVLPSGAKLDFVPDSAFTVKLASLDKLIFVMPPKGKPKDGKPNGAVISFTAVARGGRYQVTLSDEAWIDMIQDGKYSPSVEHTGVHGCPGLRKSVRFDLTEGPLVLQLSAASQAELAVAIRRVE